MGQRIDDTTLLIFENLIQASQTKGEDKIHLLVIASVKLDILKIFIRLAKNVQALDNKNYLTLQELLQEIGKMLGGWLRATKQNL